MNKIEKFLISHEGVGHYEVRNESNEVVHSAESVIDALRFVTAPTFGKGVRALYYPEELAEYVDAILT